MAFNIELLQKYLDSQEEYKEIKEKRKKDIVEKISKGETPTYWELSFLKWG